VTDGGGVKYVKVLGELEPCMFVMTTSTGPATPAGVVIRTLGTLVAVQAVDGRATPFRLTVWIKPEEVE
jgi:hypothetical protein